MIYEQIEGSTYFVENHYIVENWTYHTYRFYYVFDDKKNYLAEISNVFTRYIHVKTYHWLDLTLNFQNFMKSDQYKQYQLRYQFNNKLDKILEE